jgi:hypothetical protein
MSGLDELVLILDFLIDKHEKDLPEVVRNAWEHLKQRQAEHRPFDDAQEAD